MPPEPLIITMHVDSIALLSGEPPERAVFAVASAAGPEGQGTSRLQATAAPGQLVRWTTVSIDLQAPAWIKRIEFLTEGQAASEPVAPAADDPEPWGVAWEGVMPLWAQPGAVYRYAVHLTFGDDTAPALVVDGLALVGGAPEPDPAGLAYQPGSLRDRGGVL